jgi:ABC-2 type transport system permease protein
VSAFWALLRKELFAFWVTPLAWIVWALFLLIQGLSFFLVLDYATGFAAQGVAAGPIPAYFASLFVPTALLLVCPALTMGSFAEERKSGTLEVLLAAPISATAVVLSKYAAVCLNYALLWLPTLLYAAIARTLAPLDLGVLASSYLGVALVGGLYLALGLLMSAWTKSQLAAFMLSAALLFITFAFGVAEQVFDPGPWQHLSARLSVLGALREFSQGIVDLRRVLLHVTVSSLALLLTVRSVEALR